MEPRLTQKDVAINGQQYRLTKMDARAACWLYAVIANNVPESGAILSSLGKLSLEEFNRVQAQVLKFAFTLDDRDGTVFPTAVLAADGTWADKALSVNAAAIYELTSVAILFNLDPFLAAKESSHPLAAV